MDQIICSDEAHLHLDMHKYTFSALENSQLIDDKKCISNCMKKCVVCVEFLNHCCENGACTVYRNSERYRNISTLLYVAEIDNISLKNSKTVSIAILPVKHWRYCTMHESPTRRVNSRFVNQNGSPRSCNLKSMDLFVLSFLNSQAYASNPTITETMEAGIGHCINEIPRYCKTIIEKYARGVLLCRHTLAVIYWMCCYKLNLRMFTSQIYNYSILCYESLYFIYNSNHAHLL